MRIRSSDIFKYSGLLLGVVGLLLPLVGVIWIAVGAASPEVLFFHGFRMILLICICAPVILIPLGVALYGYGKLTRTTSNFGRGLCPKCGYSRTGLPADRACPECGAAVIPVGTTDEHE